MRHSAWNSIIKIRESQGNNNVNFSNVKFHKASLNEWYE